MPHNYYGFKPNYSAGSFFTADAAAPGHGGGAAGMALYSFIKYEKLGPPVFSSPPG